MKRTIYFILAAILIAGVSCEKENPADKVTSLELSVDKDRILDDGSDFLNVTVKDQHGRNITGDVTLMMDGTEAGHRITSTVAGIYMLTASMGDITSNMVEITVVEDAGFNYAKRVLIEQFTATWCGWCPRAISAVRDASLLDSEITHIAYHLDDEFSYTHNASLFQSFGFSGIPAMAADRSVVWQGSTSELSALHKPVRAGLALEVGGSGERISVSLDIYSGKVWGIPLKISVYLLEGGLVADQKNFYNDDPSSAWYQMGATLADFEHENVMTQTITDMYGDAIPSESLDIGSTYTIDYLFDATRANTIANCKVVAILTYGSGSDAGVVINSLSCAYGSVASNTLLQDSK